MFSLLTGLCRGFLIAIFAADMLMTLAFASELLERQHKLLKTQQSTAMKLLVRLVTFDFVLLMINFTGLSINHYLMQHHLVVTISLIILVIVAWILQSKVLMKVAIKLRNVTLGEFGNHFNNAQKTARIVLKKLSTDELLRKRDAD